MMPPAITHGGVSGQDKPIAHTFPYVSKSDPSKNYKCLVYKDGTMSCNCPGWTRRVVNGVRECKHTQCTEASLKMMESSDMILTVTRGKGHQLADPTANSKRKFNFADS